jgi:hypothetical protein
MKNQEAKRIVNRAAWLVLSLAPVLAPGCTKSVSDSPSTTGSEIASGAATVAALSASAIASAHKPRAMFGRHGGIAGSLFRAAHDLDLKEGQKDSLDNLESGLKADDEGVRTAMKGFRADLVAGVRAGKLDTGKLTADDAVVDTAIANHQAKEGDALDSLHALLDSTQRTALVNSVRAKQTEHEARMTGWMQGKESDGGASDWTKKRVDKLTADLGLDAAQQRQLAAILLKANGPPSGAGMKLRWDDMKKRLDALLTAFAGDAFDAKKADLTVMPGKTAHDPMDHMVAFFSQLLPILHADQRDKLASDLDKPFGFGGGPGMRGGPQGRGPADDIVFPFEEPVDNPPGGPAGLTR